MKYIEIFWIFLKLGCSSFGGPIAHLMYFRRSFVEQRAWLSEDEYTSIVALCQTLPGPASSQVGFTIGLERAGILGAVLAFLAFTLPSVLLLLGFAHYLPLFDSTVGNAALQGLAIVAFAVVLHGVIGMGKTLCFDKPRFAIALLTFVTCLLIQSSAVQVVVIFIGALLGFTFINVQHPQKHGATHSALSIIRKNQLLVCALWLIIFALLFMLLPSLLQSASVFYRSGALVFGGGHVVLPLLEEAIVDAGKLSQAQFLAGYGATQAVPGPMFSFASYLGFMQAENGGIYGALVATVFIFLPGFLLVLAIYPIWQTLSAYAPLQKGIAGANAAVVGLLAAALYDPIFIHGISQHADLAIAALAFAALSRFKIGVVWVVAGCVLIKILLVSIN